MSGTDKKDKDNEADWMVVASKSRIGHFYKFNKRTGERVWCSRSGTDIKAEIPATPITNSSLKTPAQDRLKRLQNNLKKNKNDENKINEKAKADLEERINARNRIFGNNKYKVPAAKRDSNHDESTEGATKRKRSDSIKSETKKEVNTNATNNELLESSNKSSAKTSDSAEVTPKKRKRKATKTNSNDFIPSTKIKKPESQTNLVPAESTTAATICATICNKAMQLFKKQFFSSKTKVENKKLEDKKDKKTNVPKEPKKSSDIVITKACESLVTTSHTKDVSKTKCTTATGRANKSLPLFNSKPSVSMLSTSYTQGVPKLTGGPLTGKDNFKSCESLLASSTLKVVPKLPSSAFTGKANERLQRLRQSLKQQVNLMESNLNADGGSINRSFIDAESQNENSNPQAVIKENEIEQMDWEPTEYTIGEYNININVTCPQPKPEPTIESTEKQRINEDIRDTYEILNKNLLRLSAENNFTNKTITKTWHKDHFYFVVDTNVLMRQLTFTDDLTKMKLCNTEGTIVFIPYIVLQELDKLKQFGQTESAKTMASRAIRHLNVKLEAKNKHLQAQSVVEDRRHLIDITSADDRIINCCLQIKENVENVILLTEDVNLQNKALCSDLVATTKSNLLSSHPETNTKS
ncbi:transcriptional protein SWT1-like [Teleopsis dalmanni]|uniref:transcriptional protein SWT1 n=1 Tax=Teleopsis dalmanni TaxID=139649 RepID=UPI000D32B0BB|nr:transcriptional protein SWT1 [Teleopsis dalmanni]XP_037939386.1 transcriptional protein SWT1-like [Teleopsis dalmanni]